MSGKSRTGYCVLEFKPQGEFQLSKDESRIIVIISAPAEGRAIVRVHPQWRSIVPVSEHNYLQELFNEFRHRAQIAPADLMNQLLTVNVGPIAMREAGQNLEDKPSLFRLFDQFQDA